MSHRKLDDACLYALRTVAGGADIYNRKLAVLLRIVEKTFPEFLIITPPPACDHVGQRPMFGVILTERGREFITPKKLTRSRSRHVEIEVRP
jgi:hypothetical protein